MVLEMIFLFRGCRIYVLEQDQPGSGFGFNKNQGMDYFDASDEMQENFDYTVEELTKNRRDPRTRNTTLVFLDEGRMQSGSIRDKCSEKGIQDPVLVADPVELVDWLISRDRANLGKMAFRLGEFTYSGSGESQTGQEPVELTPENILRILNGDFFGKGQMKPETPKQNPAVTKTTKTPMEILIESEGRGGN